MTSWSRIQSGFDVNDETINFGTRIIAENNGSLYEACTVATIQSFEKVEQQPNVIASIQHSKICVAIDKSITIFKDETCDEILCNISFPSMIASYSVSKDGFFLFVVLATRILYCLHLSDGKIIFTKTIPDNEGNVIEIFLKEQSEETFIILVTNTGAIYRFCKFYPKALEIAFTSDDKVMVAEYTADIQCSQLFKGFAPLKFLNATVEAPSEELSIAIVGTNSIFTWPNEQYINFQSVFSFGYKKIKSLHGNSKMLCLRTDQILNMICLNTFLTLKIYDGPVFDFSVIHHDDADHCEILFLTHSKDNYATYILRVISYPDFEQKLEINVSTNTYLLDVLHASDNLFYIEGIISTETGIIDTFRIKTILESIPEIRLARLLKKRHFDAAQAFAEKLNLSVEPIYCSKAALLVEQLSPWAKAASNSVNVDTLINILDKIQDVQYVIECCSKALISDYIQMKRIYSYARQRITQNIKIKDINDSLNTSLSVINDALYRLETFQMIQDTEVDTLLNDDATMKEWIRFSQANLLEECTTRLNMGQLKSATLIWTRHLPDLVQHISMQTVRNIFTILPEDVDPSYLWPWLIHFIPTLLSLLPDTINEIMSWSLKKLKYLEISHRTVWPEIGTEFAKKFIKLLKFEDNQSVYFHQEYRYQNSLLKQFMVLFQALSDIQQLKIVYRLRVPLDIYIDSPVEAIYMLLDKIHIDQISNFANTFLKQYIFNNNLQNDTVLCTYIQKIIKNSYSWWFNEEAAWEKRVTILIGLIHNMEKRLEQTLIVLRKAPVPWSSTIATLAETGINYDHSLSFKIKIECDYVPIKLILMKYGYATIGVNNKLISRIIKENCDSMINDIDVLTRNDQQLRQDAFCRCLNVRLNEKNFEKAMDIIHHLENDVASALYCYEGIINYIVAAFSFQNATSLVYHMEILGCLEFKIYNLLTQSSVCPYRCNNIIKMIKDLRSLYALKKYYKINISLKDYHTQKLLVLQNYISKFSNMKENDWTITHKTVIKVAKLLGLEKSYATLSMLEQMKNLNELEQLIDDDKDLNMVSEKFKNIHKMCLSILQHAAVDTNVVKVVKNLSISMLNTCQDSDLQSALMLYTCISACPSFSTQDCFDVKQRLVTQSNWKLYTIYKDQAISLDEKLLSLFKGAMSLHLYHSNQIDSNEIIKYDVCIDQMDQWLTGFLENMRKMQPQHNDYSLLQIFKTFYFMYLSTSVRNEKILTEMKFILSQLLMNLLRKLCTGRSFDLQLGLSVLFMLSEQEACSWLSTVSTSFQADHIRHCTISTLGYEYSRLGQNRSLIQTFESYKLLHIWAQRLSRYSITFKEVLTNSASSKRKILQQIINSNKENVIPLLKDYCCSFGFNFNDCLLNYLQILLKTWNPTITVSKTSANKELLICKDEIDELRKKCNAVVAQMEDKSMLKRCIFTLWEHITFYHYEVFIILMDLIGDKNMEKRNYLCFLQNYTRSGLPTPMEHDEWIQLNPGHSTLPPIAQWRLPFLLKVDIWKIITPELNLRTYGKWLDIAPVLNLEAHLICTLAIKGEVTQVWGNNSTASKDTAWSLYPKNTTLLKDIKKCIQRMTDSDGFYYGTAALYYVVNHTPPGADRVAAAKECYEYAQLAAQNSTKFEEGMLEKIKSKYLRFTSEHILRTYGLEKDEYLALIENPCKLVYELYNEESIPLRYRTATNYRPDINAAVNELGKLFSLNTIKLRMDLLEEWLQSNARYTELSQSFTETFLATKESDQNTNYEDNLLRICYMLEYGDMDLFAQFLINIGFGNRHGETEYSCNVRYRVFRILQTVVDTTTLEELTKQDICTFRKYMKSLQYAGKLESLGLCYSVDTFDTCCKRELVQILWKSQRHLPYALSVIAQICIEFEINDVLLWDDTLSQMTKLRMVSDLKKVLLQLRNKSVIVNCNGYKTGWQLIISEPFGEMDINPNLEKIDNCIEAICLLYSCPVAHELDFTAIVKNCFQSKQAHLAAALLPFLNESEKKFVLEAINKKSQIKELVEDLNRLSSKGVLTVPHSLAMVQKSIL
ncbi:kinetochore-associated protein 1 isoform X3 [Temnothorax curvispinosus]|uniref:Kinetochore-associated protein 1 isoform X3 n=1 Tax=Temnothorax curvispinosus TaxID=300111 RepID=A0A6J1RBH5_9HYME|nr:kinetochore-associated protein 1 isoform X3 [Temnothorax curvispinosus]